MCLRHIRARACAPAPARNTTDAAHSRRRAKPHSGRQPNRLATSGGLPGCKHGGTGGVGNHLCERRREAHSMVGVVSVASNSLVGNKEQEGRILNCQTPLAVKTITRRGGLRSPTAPFFRGTHLPPSRVHAGATVGTRARCRSLAGVHRIASGRPLIASTSPDLSRVVQSVGQGRIIDPTGCERPCEQGGR